MKPDEAYISKRDLLIPAAEARANKEFGASAQGKSVKERKIYAANWNRVYFREMDRLWGEKCLTTMPK